MNGVEKQDLKKDKFYLEVKMDRIENGRPSSSVMQEAPLGTEATSVKSKKSSCYERAYKTSIRYAEAVKDNTCDCCWKNTKDAFSGIASGFKSFFTGVKSFFSKVWDFIFCRRNG